jgi:hypothetical protein
MSRRSTLKRRRERQKRRHGQKQKLALRLQLPPVRKISTFELIQEVQRRANLLAEVFAESTQY